MFASSYLYFYILVPFILNFAFVCSWYLFSAANIRGISIVSKKIFQKGSIYLCKRLHVYAICLRAHIIKHMIISVICTNMRKGNRFFLKSPRPSLPLKRAPPLTPTLSPSGKREETAPPRRSEPLRSKVGGPSKVFAIVVRDGTAWGLYIVDGHINRNAYYVFISMFKKNIRQYSF